MANPMEIFEKAMELAYKNGLKKTTANQAAKSANKEVRTGYDKFKDLKRPTNDFGGIAPEALAAMGASALAPPIVSDYIDPAAAGGGMSGDQEAYLARQPMQPWAVR
jgi:hypothetical protein